MEVHAPPAFVGTANMRVVGTIDLGGYDGGYAVTVRPSPGLRETFERQTIEAARREHTRRAENERLMAMTAEERRAYIEEQRTKLAESKRLRELSPEERCEFIEQTRRQNAPIQFTEPIETTREADDAGEIIYKQHVDQPTTHGRDEARKLLRAADDDDGDVRSVPVSGAVRYATEWRDGDPDHDGYKAMNIWLRDNLLLERRAISRAVADVISELMDKHADEYRAVESKLSHVEAELRERDVRIARLEGSIEAMMKMGSRHAKS
jgi:hypothetical protein